MRLAYLTGKITEDTDNAKNLYSDDLPLGVLVQPLTASYLNKARLYDWVGIDNGCFTEAGRHTFRMNNYLRLIRQAMEVTRLDHMLFATAPDVPFDWEATLEKSVPVLPLITAIGNEFQQRNEPPVSPEKAAAMARMGYDSPWHNIAAICVQDGATPETVPWKLIGTVFIGGSTEWKLGPEAHAIVEEAHRRKKHVHMGRVNSLKRMMLCQRWGVHTADGTYLLHELKKGRKYAAQDIYDWLRENWRVYKCFQCGIRNPYCICGGMVEHLSREEIDARYAIPDDLSPRSVQAFLRNYVAKARNKKCARKSA